MPTRTTLLRAGAALCVASLPHVTASASTASGVSSLRGSAEQLATTPIPDDTIPDTRALWKAGWKQYCDLKSDARPLLPAAVRYFRSEGNPVYVQGNHRWLHTEQWFKGWETAGVKDVPIYYGGRHSYTKQIAHVRKSFTVSVNPGVCLKAQLPAHAVFEGTKAQLPQLPDGVKAEHASSFQMRTQQDNSAVGFDWERASGRPMHRGCDSTVQDMQSVFHFNMNPNRFTGLIETEVSDHAKIVQTSWRVNPDLVDVTTEGDVRGELVKFTWRNDGAHWQTVTNPDSGNSWTDRVSVLPRSELTVDITLAFDLGGDGKGVMLPAAYDEDVNVLNTAEAREEEANRFVRNSYNHHPHLYGPSFPIGSPLERKVWRKHILNCMPMREYIEKVYWELADADASVEKQRESR